MAENKKKVTELTQREQDVFQIMLANSKKVLQKEKKSCQLSQLSISRLLQGKYPDITAKNIAICQFQLEKAGLLQKIANRGVRKGDRPVATAFHILEDVYKHRVIVTIEKRKPGFTAGTKKHNDEFKVLAEKRERHKKLSRSIRQTKQRLDAKFEAERKLRMEIAITLIIFRFLYFQK